MFFWVCWRDNPRYVLLSPHDNTQSDLLHRINEDKNLDEIPKYKDLLKSFITKELIRWVRLKEVFGGEFTSHFGAEQGAQGTQGQGQHWTHMHKRVVEHNIRVVAEYYTRISMPRLAALLDLPADQAEDNVAALVQAKVIYAKIDR